MRRSVPIAFVTCFVFAWAVLWPDVARAQSAATAATAPATTAPDPSLSAAKQHFEAGKAAYNAGDFPTAIREFKAAEALRPSPVLAYNIGLANEKLQRRRVAVRYYRRYLEGAPSAPNRAEVEGRIAALEKELVAQPQPQVAETSQENPPPLVGDPNAQPTAQQGGQDPYATQAPMTTAPSSPRRNLWWVWLIVGIGGVVLVTGIVLGVYFGAYSNGYYYAGQVDLGRLQPIDRKATYERAPGLPEGLRGAEISPALQIRF